MVLSRRDQILKLIVDHFVKTAQPVASQTLIEEYKLQYSSATIRNEMNTLEIMGYLEKTHTSSGRIPSSQGYRYYIDNLRDNRDIDEVIKNQLSVLLNEKTKSVEEVIQESCQILSHMTSLASVVLGPNAQNEHLISIQIIPISKTTVTAVFVTDRGYVENKTFVLDDEVEVKDLEKCVKLLNDRLKGTTVAGLMEKMEAIRPILQDYVSEHDAIYNAFMEAFIRFASDRVSLYGRNELLEQPEFATDAEKIKRLIKLLEYPERIRERLNENSGISIRIGGFDEELDDVSVVTSKLVIPGHNEGTIAIVGPKRMDYEKVINALEYIAIELNRYFIEDEEREKNGK